MLPLAAKRMLLVCRPICGQGILTAQRSRVRRVGQNPTRGVPRPRYRNVVSLLLVS